MKGITDHLQYTFISFLFILIAIFKSRLQLARNLPCYRKHFVLQYVLLGDSFRTPALSYHPPFLYLRWQLIDQEFTLTQLSPALASLCEAAWSTQTHLNVSQTDGLGWPRSFLLHGVLLFHFMSFLVHAYPSKIFFLGCFPYLLLLTELITHLSQIF